MNNFIFENATKTYFGKGCVKEYLASLASSYGQTVMLAYGGGSIKRNGIYDKVMEGAKLVRENKVDLILAVGGGSVMDSNPKPGGLHSPEQSDVGVHHGGKPYH